MLNPLPEHLRAVGPIVVDVGTGTGTAAIPLASVAAVLAVDLDPAPLGSLAGTSGIVPCAADAGRLPCRDASADTAIAFEVLEHLGDPAGAIEEMARVLRPGGRMIISVPTAGTERLFSRLHPRYLANATHVNSIDRRTLTGWIDDAGLVIEECRRWHADWTLLWLVHSVLRTDADPRGNLRSHHRATQAVRKLVEGLERAPGGPRVRGALDRAVGKSWLCSAIRR